ncbi:hypothetical protein DZC73_26590 [Albitalea terrae]|uniref:Tail fiber protein n=1 Tax=Piscinibacter terrae TaxID=2496871 RepID=A0A3N7HLL0_9BURK|nr:hypothetical protein DZC73_26590 [Albitalea terrae]
MLRDGVFNVFNNSSSKYSYDKWHQAWCSGVLKQSGSSSNSGANLSLGFEDVSVGIGFTDAKSFQEMYQQKFCGNNSRLTVDLSQESAFQKTADPSLIAGYNQCRKIETKGLETSFLVAPTQHVFTVSMRYSQAFENNSRPKVKSIGFLPKGAVRCTGSIVPPMYLTASFNSLQCERLKDSAISVFVDTELGAFTRDLPAVVPPPSDTERVLAALPRGAILAWGSRQRIPGGFHVCDGTAGTPDLRDRYAIGTDTEEKIGEQMGEARHSHSGTGTASMDITKHGWAPGAQFESEGNHTYRHTHPVSITTDERANYPPSTRVVYIMKL